MRALCISPAARLLWCVTRGRRLPPAESGLAGVLAKGVHGSLYALLAAMLLSGFLVVLARGDSLFNLVRVPAFAPNDRGL